MVTRAQATTGDFDPFTLRQWREAIQRMHDEIRLPDITFKRDKRLPWLGCAEYRNGKFIITILSGLPYVSLCETLVHEVAHVLDASPRSLYRLREDHGPTWGVHYATVYSAFYGVT